jgi:transposase
MKEETRIRNELIAEDYKNGYTTEILLRKYGIGKGRLSHILTEMGFERPKGKRSLTNSKINSIINLYESGMSTREIMKNIGVSLSSVEKYIREYKQGLGIEIAPSKTKGKKYKKADETSQEYIKEYASGLSVIQIAKNHNVSRQRVYQAITASKKGKKEWKKIKSR